MTKTFCTSQKEVDRFVQCANLKERDNVLFFEEYSNKNEVFLLLHGSSNGKVLFNGVLRILKEVFQELKKENVFNILKTLGIKCISVLCCYGGFQHSYQEKGMVIKPYFNNTGVLQGEKISDNVLNSHLVMPKMFF